MPIARQRASCSGELTTSRAKISPFRQRMAAAVSTPSGAPPVPITAWTPLPTHGGRDAGREVAVADQPDARAGRADIVDQLLVPRPIEHDDDQVLDVALEAAGDRAQVVGYRRVQADGVLGARPHDQLLHVQVGRMEQAAALGRGQHRDRVRGAAWRTGWCPPADRPRCRPAAGAPLGAVAAGRGPDLLADVTASAPRRARLRR